MPTFWQNLCIRDGATSGWLLDESSGNFSDYVASNTLAAVGTWGTGFYHQPGGLPGDGDYCAFMPSISLFMAGIIPPFISAGTIEIWAAPNGNQLNSAIVSHGSGPDFEIVLVAGVYQAHLRDSGGVKTLNSGITINGSWYHLIATFDGATFCLYVNGTLAASTAAGAISYGAHTKEFYIGEQAGGTSLAAMSAEKCAVYPTALTAIQVKNHYAAATTSYRVASVVPWSGNASIARRFRDCGTNSVSMKMLAIGDSITVNMGAGLQRCLKPGKWVGFLAGLEVSAPDVNCAIQLVTVDTSWGTWATDTGGTYTFTSNGGTTHNSNGGGGDGVLSSNAVAVSVIESPFAYAHELHNGDFLFESLCRGVQPAYTVFLKQTATGDNNQFFAGLNVSQGAAQQRQPTSGTLTCSGSGWMSVSMLLPATYPAQPTVGQPGFYSIDNFVTTAGKTLTIHPWARITTGEAGFEFGNIAVGGTTLAQWSAANGIYSDDVIGTYCTAAGVDTFMVMLGANDGVITNYQAHLTALIARLRGLKTGCSIILVGSYELTHAWGNSSNNGQMADVCRTTAAADGNMLYLDLYRAFGPWQVNYANTASGSAFYDTFGIGDGVHPSDIGRRGFAELVNSLLQLAATGGSRVEHVTVECEITIP